MTCSLFIGVQNVDFTRILETNLFMFIYNRTEFQSTCIKDTVNKSLKKNKSFTFFQDLNDMINFNLEYKLGLEKSTLRVLYSDIKHIQKNFSDQKKNTSTRVTVTEFI